MYKKQVIQLVGATLQYIANVFKQNFSMDFTVCDGKFFTNQGKIKGNKLVENSTVVEISKNSD